MSDTPEEVRATLAHLYGPDCVRHLGRAAVMLECYANLLERSAGVWVLETVLNDMANQSLGIMKVFTDADGNIRTERIDPTSI